MEKTSAKGQGRQRFFLLLLILFCLVNVGLCTSFSSKYLKGKYFKISNNKQDCGGSSAHKIGYNLYF